MVRIRKNSTLLISIVLVVLMAGSIWAYLSNKEKMEVTALGDSLAYGLGDTNDNGYIGDVQHRYETDTDKELIVHDYGVPNDTSTDLLGRLKNNEIAEKAKRSDIIFINIGTNDFQKSTDH